jgi:hypothetical protein
MNNPSNLNKLCTLPQIGLAQTMTSSMLKLTHG